MAAERDRVILFVPVLLAVGIGLYFVLPFEPPMAVAVLAVLIALAAVLASRGAVRIALSAPLLVALGLLLGTVRSAYVAAPVLVEETGFVTLEGRVLEREALGGRQVRLLIGNARISGLVPRATPERIRLTHRAGGDDAMPGDRIRLRSRLAPPPDPVAPHGFDFARDSWFKRIGAVGYSVSALERLSPSTSDSFPVRLERLRNAIADRTRAGIDGPEGAIAAALLTGLRGAIRDEDAEAMRVAGLAHLLAISGLHVGLVTGAVFFVMRFLIALVPQVALRVDGRRLAALPALAIAFFYMLLAGSTPPTERAFLMIGIGLVATAIGRKAISLRLLALAAVLILLMRPEALASASFQMSFAAVTMLIAAYEALAPRLSALKSGAGLVRRLALYFLGLILTTVLAEIAILPFAAFHFNQITSYGLLANMVAVPLMAIIVMPVGLIALILMPLGLEGPILFIMGEALAVILGTAHQVADIPGAEFVVPSVPMASLALFALGGTFLLLWQHPLLKAMSLPFLITAAVVLGLSRPPDILIGRDGRLLGLMGEGELLVSSLSRERYAREQWTRMTGNDRALRWDRAVGRRPSPLSCDDRSCTLSGRGGVGPIMFLFEETALADGCREADILIATFIVKPICGVPSLIVDADDIARNGSQALWLENGRIRHMTTREVRGQRPWVREAPPNLSK